MKPLFTIHAGEYLVGTYIERTYQHWNVWVPSKDSGVDLLVTDAKNRKAVSLQVKFSKDFSATHRSPHIQKLLALGWWNHDPKKIEKSKADFWVFVLPSFGKKEPSFILLPPNELIRRFKAIHGTLQKRVQSYLWVTKEERCWEARALLKADEQRIVDDRYSNKVRDFTKFLNAWKQIETRLN